MVILTVFVKGKEVGTATVSEFYKHSGIGISINKDSDEFGGTFKYTMEVYADGDEAFRCVLDEDIKLDDVTWEFKE